MPPKPKSGVSVAPQTQTPDVHLYRRDTETLLLLDSLRSEEIVHTKMREPNWTRYFRPTELSSRYCVEKVLNTLEKNGKYSGGDAGKKLERLFGAKEKDLLQTGIVNLKLQYNSTNHTYSGIWVGKIILFHLSKENPPRIVGLFEYITVVNRSEFHGKDALKSAYMMDVARDISVKLKEKLNLLTLRLPHDTLEFENMLKELETLAEKRPYLSLCLDGGGSKAQITGHILTSLMNDINQYDTIKDTFGSLDITEIFDDLHGTSAGAIVAAILWSGTYPVEAIADEIYTVAKQLFNDGPNTSRLGRTALGLRESAYKSTALNDKIMLVLGMYEATVSSALHFFVPKLCVHVTDTTYSPYYPIKLNSHYDGKIVGCKGRVVPSKLKLIDYVRASMAAPAYLSVYPVNEDELHKNPDFLFSDGAILNNSPGLSSLCQNLNKVHAVNETIQGLTIVSIGTGYHWDQMHSSVATLANMPNMVAQTTNDEYMLKIAQNKEPQALSYFRLDFETEHVAIDDSKSTTHQEWENVVVNNPQNQKQIRDVAHKLIEKIMCKKEMILKRRKLREAMLDMVREAIQKTHD